MEKEPSLAHGILFEKRLARIEGMMDMVLEDRDLYTKNCCKIRSVFMRKNSEIREQDHQWGTVKKTLAKKGCTDLVMHNYFGLTD